MLLAFYVLGAAQCPDLLYKALLRQEYFKSTEGDARHEKPYSIN